jgi:very-short-patch-repair endonuclease
MRKGQKLGTARYLRTNQTEAERRLWQLLRAKRFEGIKFKRQVPVGPYIADFACLQQRLIVELDGGQHSESTHDKIRDAYLIEEGWRVLRFWNSELRQNREGVLTAIAVALGRL